MARLLIYTQDSMGLGHLRRSRNIAVEVLAGKPDCSVLIVADSPVTPFFSPLNGVDYLKLPTIVKTGSSNWGTSTLSLKLEDTVKLRANVILQAFSEFRPDVVLVDHMPVGALGELKPMLDSTRRPTRPKLFLGLRDVLDSAAVIHQVWTGLGAYQYLRDYDAVLIYGCRNMYDAGAAYHLIPYANQLLYCNYVAPRPQPGPAPHPPDEPFILVMGGGGADAFPLANAFLEAVPILLQEIRLRALILTGPNMPLSDRETLLARSTSYPVQVQSSFEDVTPWLREASAVVTMAGYNSLCEVLTWRKKALVVPRAGPSAEQRTRSQVFSERRLVRTLDPDILTPERLAEELIRLLIDDRIPDLPNIPPLDGAQRAATLLLGGLGVSQESTFANELARSS